MAKGSAHALATVIAGGILAPALFALGGAAPEQAVAFAGGCLAGLVLNPDLDLRRYTHAEGVLRQSGGPLGRLLARLFFWLRWPYARLIPRHRHPLSHLPVLGTAGRLLYFGLIFFGLYWLAGRGLPLPPPAPPGPLFWWAAAGLAVVDGLHTLMDIL